MNMFRNLKKYIHSLEDFEDESEKNGVEETTDTVENTDVPQNDTSAIDEELESSVIPEPMASTNINQADQAAAEAEKQQQEEIKELTNEGEAIQQEHTEIVDNAEAAAAGETVENTDTTEETTSGETELEEETQENSDLDDTTATVDDGIETELNSTDDSVENTDELVTPELDDESTDESKNTEELLTSETTETTDELVVEDETSESESTPETEEEVEETEEEEVPPEETEQETNTEEETETELEVEEEELSNDDESDTNKPLEEEKEEVLETEVETAPEKTGEIEEEGEANLDEGELDIEDVDSEITEDEVTDAKDEADEAEEEAEDDEEEIIDATRTIEDIQREKASIEEYMLILNHGISNEQFSSQYLVSVQSKLDKLNQLFGRHSPIIPSMEDYDKESISMYYEASLESFKGFVKRLDNLTVTVESKLQKWWNSGLINSVKKRAEAINKETDLLLVKLSKAPVGKIEAKGLDGALATNNTNLVQAIVNDLRILSEISVKGLKENERVQKEIVTVIDSVVDGKSVIKALNIKPATYPEAAFKEGLLGGWKLERLDPVGGSSIKAKIKNISRTSIPVPNKTKVNDRVKSVDLTKGELANLLKMVKAYTALASKIADTSGSKALESFVNNKNSYKKASTVEVKDGDEDTDGLNELASSLLIVGQANVNVYKFVTSHSLAVSQAILSIANKAIK